jgi:predicted Fe-Mo cluster-binding NifX family protein
MKIAIVTDDGQSVSPHFGRARAYLVITLEEGEVTGQEVRPKSAPHLDGGASHREDDSHDSPAAHARHDQMIEPIADCTHVIARGMGRGAYDRMAAAGIQAIVTDVVDADEAARTFADGRLENLLDRLH